mmetsp:Transcript_30935/g.87634  ORF Transcript_30935/g.87634 Transcript_30935/m.87634 type:complete len:227 (-) Transcript_30935:2394-3074(-)
MRWSMCPSSGAAVKIGHGTAPERPVKPRRPSNGRVAGLGAPRSAWRPDDSHHPTLHHSRVGNEPESLVPASVVGPVLTATAVSLCLAASPAAEAVTFAGSRASADAASLRSHGSGTATWLCSPTGQALEHFITGGIGGCVGAAAVFPIDLVKTRLQAQKGGSLSTGDGDGESDDDKKYKSGVHCFLTVMVEEGPLGLYSGLSAQLIGVWPEKGVSSCRVMGWHWTD